MGDCILFEPRSQRHQIGDHSTRNLKATLLLAVVASLVGCGENEQSLLATPTPAPTAVSWAEVRPIIESHCARCHPTYVDQAEAKRSAREMVEYLKDGTMPVVGAVEPLNKNDWNTLLVWAEGGRK